MKHEVYAYIQNKCIIQNKQNTNLKEPLYGVIHMADFRSKRHFGPNYEKNYYAPLIGTRLFKSPKRLMKWYI